MEAQNLLSAPRYTLTLHQFLKRERKRKGKLTLDDSFCTWRITKHLHIDDRKKGYRLGWLRPPKLPNINVNLPDIPVTVNLPDVPVNVGGCLVGCVNPGRKRRDAGEDGG